MSKESKSIEDTSLLKEEPKAVVASSRERPQRRAERKSMIDPGRLKFPSIPGYRTYLVSTDSDHEHRFQAFKDNWWEPVQRKEIYGSDCHDPEGFVEVKDSARLKLMKLPEELAIDDDEERFKIAAAQLEKVKGAAKTQHGHVSMDWETARK